MILFVEWLRVLARRWTRIMAVPVAIGVVKSSKEPSISKLIRLAAATARVSGPDIIAG